MSYQEIPHYARVLVALLPLLAFLLYFSTMILVAGRRKRRAVSQIAALLLSLLSLAYLWLLVCYEEEDGFAYAFFDSAPNAFIILLAALLFSSSLVFALYFGHKKRHGLSLSSFQDAYDAMEMGVCFYDEEGTLLLSNRFLVDFSDRYMASFILNGKEFKRRLEEGEWLGESVPFEGGEAYLTKDGEAYLLVTAEHLLKGKKIYELSLTPITELYRLTLETKRSNAELAESNKRLRELGEEIASLKKEEENLIAKKRIHDDIGGLLLYAKSCLDKDLSEEEKEALLKYLESEARSAVSLEKKEVGEGLLEELKKAGKEIGVKVAFSGQEIPKRDEKFVYESVLECLLNAYRHGKAKNLLVSYFEDACRQELRIENDGKVSQTKLKEGSGLKSLRSLVERDGGKMEISTSPNFLVKITITKHL